VIAGSNSVFTLSLFNFISRKLKLEIIKAGMGSSLTTARVATNIMALPVMAFQDQGYKIRKIFA
jgi:hypothetical protein